MPRDNLVVRTTLRSSCSGGPSRLLAIVLSCAVLSASDQAGVLRIRPENPNQLQQSITGGNSQKITVVVEDSAGLPVPKAAVSFRLPDTTPSGFFQNGLRSEIGITNTEGKVTLDAIRWSGATGTVPLRVTTAKDSRRAGVVLELEVVEVLVSEPVPASTAPKPSRKVAAQGREHDLGKPIVLGAAIAVKAQPPAPTDLVVPQYDPPAFWKRKWFLITLSAAGALTAGYFGSKMIARSTLSPTSPVSPGDISKLPVVIGPPTITVDKP